MPTQIRNAFSQVIERIGVDKSDCIWKTVARIIGQDHSLLEVNTAVIIYRERETQEVVARKIGRHNPPLRPWGVEFHACGTPGCEPNSRDFYIRSERNNQVRATCRACLWTSAWVKEADREGLVFQLDSSMPTIYWHDYPPPDALQNLFVEATMRRDQADVEEPR